MMWMVVVDLSADTTSIQFNAVPFRCVVTGWIDSLDFSGELSCEDILVNMNNMVELTVTDSMLLDGPMDETVRSKVIAVPPLVITVNSHLKKVSFVVQVRSSWFPLHTDTILDGEIVTSPEFMIS